MSDTELNFKQYKALCSLASGSSIKQAAYAAGVAEVTVRKWKSSPDFSRKLNESIIEVYDAGLAKLLLGVEGAIDELQSIIKNPETNDKVKVSAILGLLSLAASAKQRAIDKKITNIEAAIYGNESASE